MCLIRLDYLKGNFLEHILDDYLKIAVVFMFIVLINHPIINTLFQFNIYSFILYCKKSLLYKRRTLMLWRQSLPGPLWAKLKVISWCHLSYFYVLAVIYCLFLFDKTLDNLILSLCDSRPG